MMRRALALGLLFGAAACGDSPLGPEGFSRIPCRPPAALVAMVVGEPFAPAAMHSALVHAVDSMSTALESSPDVTGMQDAIRIVATDVTTSNYDGACRLLTIAYGFFVVLPDTPATLPDRDGIRLILALTGQSLAAAMPR